MSDPGVCNCSEAQPGFIPHSPPLGPEPFPDFPLADPRQAALVRTRKASGAVLGRHRARQEAAAGPAGFSKPHGRMGKCRFGAGWQEGLVRIINNEYTSRGQRGKLGDWSSGCW